MPPIPELAAVGGFDFRLQDRSGQGRAKLLEARNMALGLASKHPSLIGVRPEGQEPGPQLLTIEVNSLKARALGIDIANLNDTLQSVLGVDYINDFVREGRILRVQMQADARTRSTPAQILQIPVRNMQGDMVPLIQIRKGKMGRRFAQAGSLQRPARHEDIRQSRTRPQQRRCLEGNGRGCNPIAARFRFRMVWHFQEKSGFPATRRRSCSACR